MALTQIRGEQIRDGIIKDSHISATAAIAYSKLNLAGQIVASDLNANKSVEDAALDSKLITLWDMVTGIASGTGSSVTVTAAVQGSAATDTPQTAATAKGILLTGSGTNGAGITNYKVQIRNSATGEPIADGTDSDPGAAANAATVYGELRHNGTDFVLYFFKSDGSAYTFASNTNIDILFLEVFSYLTAPVKGFIAGVGFADVVGISGSHNHNDLYYTQTQLDAGQLDNRYYTETELNNGQLDTRYYTETELNPAAAATGDNVLDARYFRETELSSTASGSSGAGLIGVTAGDGLAATTVQGALAELQSDINSLVSGGLDITHSLDDAYDDGSTVAVDATNVSFNLTDTKKFVIGDVGGVGILEVEASATGDIVDIDAAAINVNSTAANLTLSTTTSGNVVLQSAGALTLKDQNLTQGIAISETGETALEGYTATSIVGALNEAKSGLVGIGPAEDASYVDGLFVDFVPATPVGTAVDRFNEVLKSLAPKPAPALSNVGIDNGGITGKLSFGTTSPISGYTNHPTLDIGGTYTKSGDAMGIFDNVGTMSGYLASTVASGGTNDRPYPARAIGNGDQGTLKLLINGTQVHSVDLSTFGSGSSLTGSSGFINLSAATSVKFDNGDNFDVFKYRTGSWQVSVADCVPGYNTLQVVHTVGSTDYSTNILNFVIDSDTTATSYSADTLSGLSMTGSKYISGVNYHTGGTAIYAATASNVYKNTYNSGATAVNYTGVNCSIADEALPAPASNTSDLVLSGKIATVATGSRLLNASISVQVNVARTLQTTSTSTARSISGLLLDNTTDGATAINDSFDGETFRMMPTLSLTTTAGYNSSGSSPAEWDSSQSLVGADAAHNTGLLVYDGTLRYPKTGLNAGNFSTVANGPAGNPDYSSASGNRTYLRYFYTASAKSNFRLNITSTSTSFVPVATGVSGNNLTLEVLAPDTTKNSSGTAEFKDACVAYTDDASIGCYAATYGGTIPTSWGITLGTKNTSTSGNVVVIRITASASWTGNISNIALTWL